MNCLYILEMNPLSVASFAYVFSHYTATWLTFTLTHFLITSWQTFPGHSSLHTAVFLPCSSHPLQAPGESSLPCTSSVLCGLHIYCGYHVEFSACVLFCNFWVCQGWVKLCSSLHPVAGTKEVLKKWCSTENYYTLLRFRKCAEKRDQKMFVCWETENPPDRIHSATR